MRFVPSYIQDILWTPFWLSGAEFRFGLVAAAPIGEVLPAVYASAALTNLTVSNGIRADDPTITLPDMPEVTLIAGVIYKAPDIMIAYIDDIIGLPVVADGTTKMFTLSRPLLSIQNAPNP